MTPLAIATENVSKVYRLKQIGTGTLRDDIHRWWTMKVRRQPDPLVALGTIDHGNREGGRIWAIRDINLEVRQGDIVGIIGRNGAGKSTLLKVLSCITAPTQGTVRVRGTLSSMLEVGTGFQPDLTGRENIFLQGSVLGLTAEQVKARYRDIVAFSEIERFMETPVKRYSSGMFVRLAFAVSAYLDSDIMIVDEVLGVGDVGFQKKCIHRMREIADSGRTILFVSHRMDQINAFCNRAVLLDRGLKVADGPTKEVTSRYFSLFETEERKHLRSRADRRGRGRVRFVDAWIENSAGQKTSSLQAGKEARFVVSLENRTDAPVHNLYVTIGIFSVENMFVGSLSSRECGLPPLSIDRQLRIQFAAPTLPINAGRFYFNCNVQTSLGAYEYDDLIENAGLFTIESAVADREQPFARLTYKPTIIEG